MPRAIVLDNELDRLHRPQAHIYLHNISFAHVTDLAWCTPKRPFACPSCPSTFARDSHLKAHVRTHADATEAAESKKYACDRCDKKFWTGQHLRKHVEVVHEGKTYDVRFLLHSV